MLSIHPTKDGVLDRAITPRVRLRPSSISFSIGVLRKNLRQRKGTTVYYSAGTYPSGELAHIRHLQRSWLFAECVSTLQLPGVRMPDNEGQCSRSQLLELTSSQRKQFDDILRKRPGSLRLGDGHRTSPMIAWVIEDEFGIQ